MCSVPMWVAKGLDSTDPAALADDLLDLVPHGIQADPQRLQRLRPDTFALADEAEQDVLGTDVVVIERPGFVLRLDNTRRALSVNLSNIVRAALLTLIPALSDANTISRLGRRSSRRASGRMLSPLVTVAAGCRAPR